jgi:hypothetical protein
MFLCLISQKWNSYNKHKFTILWNTKGIIINILVVLYSLQVKFVRFLDRTARTSQRTHNGCWIVCYTCWWTQLHISGGILSVVLWWFWNIRLSSRSKVSSVSNQGAAIGHINNIRFRCFSLLFYTTRFPFMAAMVEDTNVASRFQGWEFFRSPVVIPLL